MGCVSSKLVRKDLKREITFNNGGECVNHLVSLTSSTYGALNLDRQQPTKDCVGAESRRLQRSPPREEPEVIDAWELMEGLEEGMPISNQAKKSPKPRAFLRGFSGFDARSPMKFSNQSGSPKKARRFAGKENKGRVNLFGRADYSPKAVLKAKICSENSCKAVLNLSYPVKGSPIGAKRESPGRDSDFSSRRKSFSPLFDPELLASYEKELSEEEEQIKMMVSPTPKARRARKSRELEAILDSFERKCPPGGENAVVIYTTTLRGIRKTFEDCNKVRSIIESHCIHVFERDISMDSGFKEELRGLMGTKEVKVPLVFVKGRLIGGGDELVKLEEEGKLSILFDGIPRALGGCEGCAGVRFVMCMDCNGSCKILDSEQKKMVRCGQCNENGLIQCPVCC
ncbi:hypothetical protein FH972_016616 [Carpinus fangiana]|uniref:Glutaredoxin domain-containing protein n=1 Tax=Carpinus fangiana TaxID=176857 RepID=A0A5N6RHP4_9ROSI|nr:hypothetical protein FH972_016616 [Carpinus fangiana]